MCFTQLTVGAHFSKDAIISRFAWFNHVTKVCGNLGDGSKDSMKIKMVTELSSDICERVIKIGHFLSRCKRKYRSNYFQSPAFATRCLPPVAERLRFGLSNTMAALDNNQPFVRSGRGTSAKRFQFLASRMRRLRRAPVQRFNSPNQPNGRFMPNVPEINFVRTSC